MLDLFICDYVYLPLTASPEKRDFLQQAYAEFRHQLQASSEPEHGWSDLRFRSHLYLPWLSDLLLESDLSGRLIVSARQAPALPGAADRRDEDVGVAGMADRAPKGGGGECGVK